MKDTPPTPRPASAYFTIVGSQDPQVTPEGAQGPALDLLDALMAAGEEVTEVLLAWTPGAKNPAWPGGYDVQRKAVEDAVRARLPGVTVEAVPVRVRPNAGAEVLPVLAQALERFRHGGQLHVNTSSGTPQMLEALKVLRGTGWFAGGDVHLWQIDRPEHRRPGAEYWREAGTPFLEEAFKLDAAFSALRRFDFAGARDAFAGLAGGRLELPGRGPSVRALEAVADALWWVDARDAAGAGDALAGMAVHVPAVVPLRDLLAQAQAVPDEVLIWLTWGRYDRAAEQERVADALVWAVVLHELLVVKLAEQRGLPDTSKGLRARDLPSGLFDQLGAQVPEALGAGGRELRFMTLKEKLALLRAPVLEVPNVAVFDAGDRTAEPNPRLARLREQRNVVIHQGHVPADVDMNEVDEVVKELLRAFPFTASWARAWAPEPGGAPVSAVSLRALTDALQGWVG